MKVYVVYEKNSMGYSGPVKMVTEDIEVANKFMELEGYKGHNRYVSKEYDTNQYTLNNLVEKINRIPIAYEVRFFQDGTIAEMNGMDEALLVPMSNHFFKYDGSYLRKLNRRIYDVLTFHTEYTGVVIYVTAEEAKSHDTEYIENLAKEKRRDFIMKEYNLYL